MLSFPFEEAGRGQWELEDDGDEERHEVGFAGISGHVEVIELHPKHKLWNEATMRDDWDFRLRQYKDMGEEYEYDASMAEEEWFQYANPKVSAFYWDSVDLEYGEFYSTGKPSTAALHAALNNLRWVR